MWLPVMNNFHIALKLTAYTCVHYGKKKNVEPATMTDINKTIMRCLTKNLAMFGAGINIYSGEDLPLSESDFLSEEEKAVSEQEKEKAKEKAQLDRYQHLFSSQTFIFFYFAHIFLLLIKIY
jgi:hypothetical protein